MSPIALAAGADSSTQRHLLADSVRLAQVVAWIALLSLPNLIAIADVPVPSRGSDGSFYALLGSILRAQPIRTFAIGAGISILLLVVLGRTDRFVVLTLPLVLLMPAEAWYVAEYGGHPGVHVLGVLAETNPGEAIEFVSGRWPVICFVVLVSAFASGALFLALFRQPRVTIRSVRRRLALAVLGVAALLSTMPSLLDVATADAAPRGLAARELRHFHSRDVEEFAEVYPWGVPIRLAEYAVQRRMRATAAASLDGFRFDATLEVARAPVNVVLVIGESLRADHLSLNGYSRATTPTLQREPGLVSFSNAIAATPGTRTSVPYIVTRMAPGRDGTDRFVTERSLLSAFREAGYRTWWLSNQMTYGEHDTMVSLFAGEADVGRHLSLSSYSQRSAYDTVLIQGLVEALASPASRRMVVLHMLGSHFNYRNRYPATFDRFTPTPADGEAVTLFDRADRERIVNAYDNSVLFTDHVLGGLIAALKATGEDSVLLFVSDHGEALFDGACPNSGHGMLSATNLHVPLIVWLSPKFAGRRAAAASALQSNRDRAVTVESVFPTLLDLGGVRIDRDKRELSLASEGLSVGPRYVSVDARSWIDYDRDLAARDCARTTR